MNKALEIILTSCLSGKTMEVQPDLCPRTDMRYPINQGDEEGLA